MSAEITQRADGTAEAMYARVPAWHGLGTVLVDAPHSEDAIKAAHLDWEVGTIPVVVRYGDCELVRKLYPPGLWSDGRWQYVVNPSRDQANGEVHEVLIVKRPFGAAT